MMRTTTTLLTCLLLTACGGSPLSDGIYDVDLIAQGNTCSAEHVDMVAEWQVETVGPGWDLTPVTDGGDFKTFHGDPGWNGGVEFKMEFMDREVGTGYDCVVTDTFTIAINDQFDPAVLRGVFRYDWSVLCSDSSVDSCFSEWDVDGRLEQ